MCYNKSKNDIYDDTKILLLVRIKEILFNMQNCRFMNLKVEWWLENILIECDNIVHKYAKYSFLESLHA